MNRLLIIDDDVDTCTLLDAYLGSKGYKIEVAYSGNKGIQKFKEGNFDLILCDYRLGDRDGVEILKEVRQVNPRVRVIIITAYSDIKTAVKVIKEGAFDYISKPLIPDEVLNVIHNAQMQSREVSEEPKTEDSRKINKPRGKVVAEDVNEYLKGNDCTIKQVYKEVQLVAPTNYSVILYGESGTGKEVIAQTIHKQSRRAGKPFIALDCGILSRELAGSELFGHVKGAFTGALSDKVGHFEMANGGTLFLDEVSNLSYDIQASLLRVIQERKFKRIGGTSEMNLDIRIIVASNENLEEAYRKGKFREDLYHRLNEFSVILPPLRERKEDIPLFAYYFLEKTNKELGKDITDFGEGAMEALVSYPWPGNIRELKNVIRRASLLSNNNKITKENLPWNPNSVSSNSKDEIAAPAPVAPKKNGIDTNLKESASLAEYETLMKVLKQVNYNKSQAAIILNVDRKTLYNKLKKFREELFHDNEL